MFTLMLDQGKPTLVAIVDDDESMRAALQGLVQDAGLPTCIFESGEAFLASGKQRETGCLIADIRLPGISGLELQSRLNAEHHKIPIVFITAHGDEEMRFQALRAGAAEFLAKPFDDEILLDFVRAALSR
jgi:FixJ family two-component response regulator